MTGNHERSPEHRKAHDLAEEAIEKAADGNLDEARKLAEQAKDVDPKIPEEMGREIEEDRRKAEGFQGKQDR
jgi:hypothetical protein